MPLLSLSAGRQPSARLPFHRHSSFATRWWDWWASFLPGRGLLRALSSTRSARLPELSLAPPLAGAGCQSAPRDMCSRPFFCLPVAACHFDKPNRADSGNRIFGQGSGIAKFPIPPRLAVSQNDPDTVGECSRSVATPPVIGKTDLQSGRRTGLPGCHLREQTANFEFANSV